MTTLGIVGTGAVGQSVVIAVLAAHLAEHIVVVSRTHEKAVALAADAQDLAVAIGSGVAVAAADSVSELRDCDAIVVCVRGDFHNTDVGDVRMAGLLANAEIVYPIAVTLHGYCGVVLMVTNPVDILSPLVAAMGGCRTYGIGGGLDTARYRALLAAAYSVPATVVDGYVVGEHGDGAVCCVSSTRIDGAPIDPGDPRTVGAVEAFRARSTVITAGVGRVRAGVAGAVLSAVRATLGMRDTTEVLSTRSDLDGVWIGQPVHFQSGHAEVRMPELDPDERWQLDVARPKLLEAYTRIRQHLSIHSLIATRR